MIVFIIKNAITNCCKNKKEKKRQKNSEIKGTRIDRDHMTDRKGAKTLRRVAAFLCGAE